MIGLVLCGGASTRMGTDKGLISENNIRWTDIASNSLMALQLPVFLSVSEVQYGVYASTFRDAEFIKDDPNLKVGGPLKGILSAHLCHPNQDVMATACDMPNMQQEVLNELIRAHANIEGEAFVFKDENNIEPLTGIYTSNGLHKIYSLYKEGRLTKFSLHHVLTILNTHYLLMPEEWKSYFKNFNTPHDLYRE